MSDHVVRIYFTLRRAVVVVVSSILVVSSPHFFEELDEIPWELSSLAPQFLCMLSCCMLTVAFASLLTLPPGMPIVGKRDKTILFLLLLWGFLSLAAAALFAIDLIRLHRQSHKQDILMFCCFQAITLIPVAAILLWKFFRL